MSRGPNSKTGKARWWCLCECDTGVLVLSTHLLSGHAKSCGCLNIERLIQRIQKWNKEDRTGKNNPNWNPNLTDEERIANRDYPEYIDWRIQVYKRDNYTCQKCAQRGTILNAHHIEAFAGNKELRTELSNGITLCKACHKNFHHQYGHVCTRADWDDFIEDK